MQTFSLFDLFSLLGGLALFLYGMQQGEKNIRRIGGNNLKKFLSVITRHPLFAFFAGLFTTLITQSSSATTVILVGLVNARIMTLGQSLGMILGSDLGTTVTVQLFAFKFYQVAPLMIAAGYFASINRNKTTVSMYGKLLLAIGLIFFGMRIMSASVTPLHTLPYFEKALQASLSNPWLGLLAGTIITAVIQSSAATLTIVIALLQSLNEAHGGPPPVASVLPVVMGANLGTCATAFLSTLRADISGTRVAWAHFLFKLFGTALFFSLIPLVNHITPLLPHSPALQVAVLHTIFNLCICVFFLPLLHPFEKMVTKVIRGRSTDEHRYRLEYLSDSVISLPVLALSQTIKEIGRMAEQVRWMADESLRLISSFSIRQKEDVAEKDNEVDFLHEHIVTFLTKMSKEELDNESADYTYKLLMITTDLEHIGDSISKNIINLAEKIDTSPLPLSTEGKEEILGFYRQAITDLGEVLAAFTMNKTDLAQMIFNRKKTRDEHYNQLFSRHMDRLFNRKPESLETTSIHIDLLEEIRRIDHFVFRISAHILKVHKVE
jgi:phosphate:Na+ symporter